MEKARKHLRDQGGTSPRVHRPRPTMAPVGYKDSNTHHIPGHRTEELEEASVPQDQDQVPIGCPEGSHLQAGATTESRSSPSADQGQSQKTHDQEEEEWVPKGDHDEAQKMLELLDSFSKGQLTREEAHRQSAFPREAIRHLVQSAAGGAPVEENALIAMAGMAKFFVQEVVEEALDVCERWGETPPLQPKHLREAVLRLRAKGPTSSPETSCSPRAHAWGPGPRLSGAQDCGCRSPSVSRRGPFTQDGSHLFSSKLPPLGPRLWGGPWRHGAARGSPTRSRRPPARKEPAPLAGELLANRTGSPSPGWTLLSLEPAWGW